ncbi:MAG: hypothetical protein SGJ13_17055 [Actinomycetota bacterium]|nr:hypothetical protein [Actinomycetota bacterium]
MRKPVSVVAIALAISFALLTTGCGGDDDSDASDATIAELATEYDWPANAPGSADLEAFAAAGGGEEPSPRTAVERANMCVWYSAWLAAQAGGAGDQAAIETYMADVIPSFEFVKDTPGAVENVQSVARSANDGDEAPVAAFVDANDCELLDS